MMDQKRMTYIPHPPSLKCFHAAAIEPSSVWVYPSDPLSTPRLGKRSILEGADERLASELVTSSYTVCARMCVACGAASPYLNESDRSKRLTPKRTNSWERDR